jgi:hypothetical protein
MTANTNTATDAEHRPNVIVLETPSSAASR